MVDDFLKTLVILNDEINSLKYIIEEKDERIDYLENLNGIPDKRTAERTFIELWKKDKEKLDVYEKLLHDLDLAIMCHSDRVSTLVSLIQKWSYAHRAGNGEKSDEEVQEAIDKAFNNIKEAVCRS